MIILFLLGAVLLGYAAYMLRYDAFCRKGPKISIVCTEIKKEYEMIGYSYMEWYSVVVKYNLAEMGARVYSRVGPDKKSSWFLRREDAVDFLSQLELISESRVNIFGAHLLVSRLSKRRKEHHLSILLSGVIIILLSFCVGWLQYAD